MPRRAVLSAGVLIALWATSLHGSAGQAIVPSSMTIPAQGSIRFTYPPPPCPRPQPGMTPGPCPTNDSPIILVVNRSALAVQAALEFRTLTISAAAHLAVDIIETDTAPFVSCAPSNPARQVVRCEIAPYPNVIRVVFTVVDSSVPERVSYRAGLNLIGAPRGTVISSTDNPIVTFVGDTGLYREVEPGEPLEAGQGYWVRYRATEPNADVGQALAEAPEMPMAIAVPAGRYVLIGNPFHTHAHVEGVDALFVYSPMSGYQSAMLNQRFGRLSIGEGAWALSLTGGNVVLRPARP